MILVHIGTQLTLKQYWLKKANCQRKIADFLSIFSNYCYYIGMIAEPVNERVIIVRSSFEREKIDQHKQKIETLRIMALEMLYEAGKIPIYYPGVNSKI